MPQWGTPTKRRLVVLVVATCVLVPALSATNAWATVQTCNWVGGGTHINNDYPWTASDNWDAGCGGTPSAGAIVTIDAASATNITDIPSVSLSQLNITNDGSVPLALVPTTAGTTVTVTGSMSWRSATISAGLNIELAASAQGLASGTRDTGDLAILDGGLTLDGNARFEVRATGTALPIGQADAVFRVGPHAGGDGVINVAFTAFFDIDDHAVVASDQAGSPGLLSSGGVIEDANAGLGFHAYGAQVVAMTVDLQAGGAVGAAGLLDFRDDVMTFDTSLTNNDTQVGGGGVVQIGGGTDATMTGTSILLTQNTTLQLGDRGDTGQIATFHGGTFANMSDFSHGYMSWYGATLSGAPATIESSLAMSNGAVAGTAPRRVDADLTLSNAFSLTLDGPLVVGRDATVHIETQGFGLEMVDSGFAPRTSIRGGGTIVNDTILQFGTPDLRVQVAQVTIVNRGTFYLGRGALSLGTNAAFRSTPSSTLVSWIEGKNPAGGYGAIVHAGSTSGQQVKLAGTFRAKATITPDVGQRFKVITVPFGSVTGSFDKVHLPTTPTANWTQHLGSTSYILRYLGP